MDIDYKAVKGQRGTHRKDSAPKKIRKTNRLLNVIQQVHKLQPSTVTGCGYAEHQGWTPLSGFTPQNPISEHSMPDICWTPGSSFGERLEE